MFWLLAAYIAGVLVCWWFIPSLTGEKEAGTVFIAGVLWPVVLPWGVFGLSFEKFVEWRASKSHKIASDGSESPDVS